MDYRCQAPLKLSKSEGRDGLIKAAYVQWLQGAGASMSRLQKFVEKGRDGPARVAYAFGAERLPPAEHGRQWELVAGFNPAEELLENGSLRAVFQTAIAEGCAVTPNEIGR